MSKINHQHRNRLSLPKEVEKTKEITRGAQTNIKRQPVYILTRDEIIALGYTPSDKGALE